MHIKFTKDLNNGLSFYNSQDPCIVRAIGRAAEFCLNSKIFSLLTLGHLHTFIHELGHAVAYRTLTGGEATIHIALNTQSGITSFGGKARSLSPAGATWVNLSGPLADLFFLCCAYHRNFCINSLCTHVEWVTIRLKNCNRRSRRFLDSR
jgi:hypothetical protein